MKQTITHTKSGFIKVQLPVLVFQEGESYLAFCPALNLSTYGDSVTDVKIAFVDVIKSYLEDGIKMGTLEQDLIAHGWQMQLNKKIAEPPQQTDLSFPIFSGLLRQHFNQQLQIPIPQY